MKKARMLILVAVIVMALFAAVIPALAIEDYEIYNMSFEGDKNGDNIPDKWNVKGDVVRLCDTNFPLEDNCMMVFLPSSHGAALWQLIERGGQNQPVWAVVTEEGEWVPYLWAGVGFKGLDTDRAYIGAQILLSDGSVYTTYSVAPPGNFPWDDVLFFGKVGGWALDYTEDDIVAIRYGALMLPGDGYFALDYLIPYVATP